ncbi:hypothetical protein B0T17DRAFT_563973 [Bombardia bombarda]|uniref:Septation initiation network scaffold protein cdc11 n=1 Tax=Bombardia bombarda TaxID=252184 RepID=A0AA39W4Y5_9PEZI|nr:hypothetical protein B0T17DRAFT_563973 [Bombardia bombarda]
MGHAWLDSLSEDWVSHHGSADASFAEPEPAASASSSASVQDNDEVKPAKTTASAAASSPSHPPTAISRIPRLTHGDKKSQLSVNDNSSKILGERSVNEIMSPGSRRFPSKLSQEITQPLAAPKRNRSGRSLSTASSSNSVVHNTVNHKSTNSSPGKKRGDTPEWKRRLVYGDLSYGEHRDLFTSAGIGLANMFKPPPPAPEAPAAGAAHDESYEESSVAHHEVTLPSSPPPYHRDPSTVEILVDESVQSLPQLQQERRTRRTSLRYRRANDSAVSSNDSYPSQPQDSSSQEVSTTEKTGMSGSQQGDGDKTESRKVSGQSDVRNEALSPILIQRRQASNGKTGYAPADLPPDELRKRLQKLRRNQMLLATDSSSGGSDNKAQNAEATVDYEGLGGFINTQRGGRSREGSFQNHMLSSGLNDTSELHPEESLQASTPKQFPTIRLERWDDTEEFPIESPDIPRVPDPSPDKRPVPALQHKSSGSPLKLFQPYDTFTNQTLLRRLSQFNGEPVDDSPSQARQQTDESFVSTADISQNDADQSHLSPPRSPTRRDRREKHRQSYTPLSRFGAGELDGYAFSDDFSYDLNGTLGLDADKENCGPDESSMQLPRAPLAFTLDRESSPSEEEELMVRRSRQKSMNSVLSRRSGRSEMAGGGGGARSETRASMHNAAAAAAVLSTPQRRDTSEFKRPRTSPSKDPTPKRRRTLHKSDIGYDMEEQYQIDSVQLSHQQMQSIITKQLKESQNSEQLQLTHPAMVATGGVARPRTPTPSQRLLGYRGRVPVEGGRSPGRSLGRSIGHAQPSPRAPGAKADSDRKPSIRTEDFINEANKIMAMIRSKAGLASGLASLEESDAENAGQQRYPDPESSYQESTQEPFSRPPSREGRAPITHMSARQEDPELAERLKKYEEASDMGDIGASMRSVRLGQQQQQQHQGFSSDQPHFIEEGEEVISDPPNIRISRNPERYSTEGSNYDGVPSHGSGGSSGNYTGRSIPTTSSRGSQSRGVVLPQHVEHVLKDQVGNMVLDRNRNIWIKTKQPAVPLQNHALERAAAAAAPARGRHPASEASEDDIFADIPDLSVDMTMEMQNLAAARRELAIREEAAAAARLDDHDDATASGSGSSPNETFESYDAEFSSIRKSEVMRKRLSAYSTRRRNLTISFTSPLASIIHDMAEFAALFDEDFSRDSIKRGRRVASQLHKHQQQQQQQQQQHRNASSRSRSDSRGASAGSGNALPQRHLSVRGQKFVARPISRIDERDEESVVDRIRNQHLQHQQQQSSAANMELSVIADNSVLSSRDEDSSGLEREQLQQQQQQQRQTSLSFVVTPARPRDCSVGEVGDAAPLISQYVGTFSLSPLSEFTIHHGAGGDETLPLEASYVVGNHRLVTGDHSKRVMSMNMRVLVEKLAEVEPFEPYWEDMKELELRGRRLGSLHALDEFCGQLESLDVSGNDIRNLSGIPGSVRQLKLVGNRLSSLTSWGHLMNLQYVDISGNGLTSLSAFKHLVHLRSLRADDNEIESLDGIKFHDGLQSLRARGNRIGEIDFCRNGLGRLTELDLKGNVIGRVRGLGGLGALSSLNLEGNLLEGFMEEEEAPLLALRHLRLDDNMIREIDLGKMPHVRLVHADRNRIVRVGGLSRARRIDSLSLREQRGEKGLDVRDLLSRAYEVRKLYLSGNFFGGGGEKGEGEGEFAPSVDFLNLQLLEVANCGLRELPEDLGLMMPNLRVLNVNMNALTDLTPLRGVPRLKRLLASGNRLADAAALVETLGGFKCLGVVDVRDNPVTQGFYAPGLLFGDEKGLDVVEVGSGSGADPFALPDQDGERDALYSSRLDLETRMRRRLHEKMVGESCGRLKKLDGLSLRGRRGKGEVRDAVWKALVEGGFVVPVGEEVGSGGGGDVVGDGTTTTATAVEDGEGEVHRVDEHEEVSARWPAEDSFGG